VGHTTGGQAPDLAERSEEWLRSRLATLGSLAQGGTSDEQPAAVREMETLVVEARRRGRRPFFLYMLNRTAGTLVAAACSGHRADHLIGELLDFARAQGLWLHEVAGHVYLARQDVFAGRKDSALRRVATALAALDQGGEPYPWFDRDDWLSTLGAVLSDSGLVLAQLGLFEQSAPLLERAQRVDEERGDQNRITTRMWNRVRMELGWALRLERAGKDAEAAGHFAEAAAVARAVEEPWPYSLHPQRHLPAVEVLPVLAAAHALAEPGAGHVDRLRRTLDQAIYAREMITAGIALSRCLARAGRPAEGLAVLRRVGGRMVGDSSEPSLALSMAHEVARLSQAVEAKLAYAEALEAELWALHRARVATMRTRIEHERLGRRHSEAARQAMHDPLTGLLNRRALTETLRAAGTEPGWSPSVVAVVDVDGFKAVNDRLSHAAGDEALRLIAQTLRNTTREDDVVVRYGGDEFVVLLRRTSPQAAETVLSRMGRAVAALPVDRGHGVTLSVGACPLRTGEPAERALRLADEAMYLAKRQGGNRVCVTSVEAAPAV
jgi:diguanylate cyclase (GGDEF)-like protein